MFHDYRMVADAGSVELAHAVTFDKRDRDGGRTRSVIGDVSTNMESLVSSVHYVVHRLYDPLVHAAGRWSSRTRCNYQNLHWHDTHEAAPFSHVTCLECFVLGPEKYRTR